MINLKFILKTVLFCGLALSPLAAGDQPEHTISITAQRFSFTPNEITLKKGQPVKLVIETKDVTHGLVIEGLGIRSNEIKKGQAAEVTFNPETVGTFEGKCAHFCGKGHGSMTITVRVVE